VSGIAHVIGSPVVPEELLSVEEVAERLDVSVATVRRMCARGDLPARRVGRGWVIEASDLPTRRRGRRRTGGEAAGYDLERAMGHVLGVDERERWIPDILRHEDLATAGSEQIAIAAERLDGTDAYDAAVLVEIPKSSFFTRTGHLLSLPDRIAYQAAVAALAPAIEARLRPAVFSSRLKASTERYFLEKSRDQWLKWKAAVINDVVQGRTYVIRTDVNAYFDSIRHDLLIPELQSLPGGGATAGRIREMLRRWAEVPNNGLPQGPNASRVLGNFFLIPVDDAMTAHSDVGYFRYMDDIRLTAQTRSEAIGALKTLERECKLRGLTLSAQKTKLMRAPAAIGDFEDDELAELQYSFDVQPGDPDLATRLVSVLRSAIRGQDGLNERRARFSLWRLHRLRDSTMRSTVLKNLETMAPLGPIVSAYLRPWITNASVQRRITDFLMDADRNTSSYLSCWLMALMLEVRERQPQAWLDYATTISLDRNQPSWHRAISLNVMAYGASPAPRRALRDVVLKEHDPQVVRAALVALFRVGALDRALAAQAQARFPWTRWTLDYLRGRAALPSLIESGATIRLVR
jgi:excisionase family DNA binding protein